VAEARLVFEPNYFIPSHLPSFILYGSMAFSIFVEALNIGARRKKSTPPVLLHDRPSAE